MRKAAFAVCAAVLLSSVAQGDSGRVLNPVNQHLYQRFDGGLRWHDARDFCALLGGHLATISTAQEDEFLYTNFGYGWLGATDEQEEGVWRWVTGEPWGYQNWAPGEPNNCCPSWNCGGTGCTAEYFLTHAGAPNASRWNDVPDLSIQPICEWDSAADVRYEFTWLDYPEAPNTWLFGINPQRQVVGWHGVNGAWHSFVWKNDAFVSFDVPGATNTQAHSIDPQGEIVGKYQHPDRPGGKMFGFLLKDGVFLRLDYPNSNHTVANDITANGLIVGPYIGLDGIVASFVLRDGVFKSFAVPGASSTDATGINAAGDVVGTFSLPDGRQPGFLFRQGQFHVIEYPGSTRTWAFDINEPGDIVGFSGGRGFLLKSGRFFSITAPGSVDTWVTRINPAGDMVGHARGPDNRWRGFLLFRVLQP